MPLVVDRERRDERTCGRMIYRTYGRFGYEISQLGFGAMRLPNSDDGELDMDLSVACMRKVMPKGGLMEVVQKAKDEGLIRHICVSTHQEPAMTRQGYSRLGAKDAENPSPFQAERLRADACVECGECADKCPQHIDIPAQLKEVADTLG